MLKLTTPPHPTPLLGGQGLQIKSFLAGKRGKYRGKKEVAATVLIKTITYYENTKYTLKKVENNQHNCHVFKFFT